jgi:hypothetical protein
MVRTVNVSNRTTTHAHACALVEAQHTAAAAAAAHMLLHQYLESRSRLLMIFFFQEECVLGVRVRGRVRVRVRVRVRLLTGSSCRHALHTLAGSCDSNRATRQGPGPAWAPPSSSVATLWTTANSSTVNRLRQLVTTNAAVPSCR